MRNQLFPLSNLIRWYVSVTPEHRGKDSLRKLTLWPQLKHLDFVEVSLFPYKKLRIVIYPKQEIGRAIFLNGLYEKDYALKFCKLIRPGDIILDVGANSGQYTLLGSLLTGEKGWVYAFEPAPHKYQELVDHVELNHLENVSCLPYALSNVRGKAYLNLQKDTNDGMHHLVTVQDADQQVVEVEAFTLNECLNSIVSRTPIDLIKIDVEGWEEAVFQGGSKVFAQTKPPTIFFESIEEHANRFGFSARRVQHLLEEHGYQLFSKKHFSSRWAPLSSETEQINLIAIHPSRADLIRAL